MSLCKYAQRCLQYRKDSFTCNSMIEAHRNYCGKHKELSQ